MKIKKYQTGGSTGGNSATDALTGNIAFTQKLLPQIQSLTPKEIFNSQNLPTLPTTLSHQIAVPSKISSLSKLGKGILTNAATVGQGLDVVGSLLGNRSEYSGSSGQITQGMDSITDMASNVAMTMPGIGTAVGLGLKGLGVANKLVGKLGGGTDGMTNTDAILGSSLLGLSPLGLINGFGGKKSKQMGMNDQYQNQKLTSVWDSYGGTKADDNYALSVSGKKYGAFSGNARRKANAAVDKATWNRTNLLGIANQAQTDKIRGDGMASINNISNAINLQGGIDNRNIRVGQRGLKIPTVKDIQDIKIKMNSYKELHKSNTNTIQKQKKLIKKTNTVKKIDKIDVSDVTKVPQFKEGGSVNVIPEGSLHARLNKMEGGGETITKKGIPVVDTKGEQQAEIEKNEIIFRKEVTTKIEELAKDGSDEAALECGKLLATEILENTDDRTGLTKTLKQGGTIEFKNIINYKNEKN